MPTSTGWPRTKIEWQEAVNLASLMIHIDSARQYGLTTGGPSIDAERCQSILVVGAARGYRPIKADVDAAMRAIAVGDDAGR